MKPRIAIPVPTSTDIPYNDRSWPAYAAAVCASGGEPVKLDLTATPAEILALARWSTMYQQLLDLKVIQKPIDPTTAYTTRFLK